MVIPTRKSLRCTAAALLLSLTACGFFAPTVTVEDVGPTKVFTDLNEFVLDGGTLSAGTIDTLHAADLSAVVDHDPAVALTRLHGITVGDPSRGRLFALAELAFHVGELRRDRAAYLASAVYAYSFLLGEPELAPASPYDRRFRQACDLYNNALLNALHDGERDQVVLEQGRRGLPVGHIDLAVDRAPFGYTAEEYPELVAADRFRIHGLTLRLRDSGLGVPLIAIPDPARAQLTSGHGKELSDPSVDAPSEEAADDASSADDALALDPTPSVERRGLTKMPANVFLRVDGSLADMRSGLRGTLELHQTLDSRSVTVADQEVPLESDLSVTLAYALHRSPLWKFSLRGLFHGEAAVQSNRLLFMRTPERGRIPVVFVHGTASNPAYWAPMLNVLVNDPVLRSRTQCWFFQYASGNPLLYSSMTLREQLEATIRHLDPDGTDPDLQRMVVIGHSQGGLLTKLTAVDGSTEWLEEMLGGPMDEFGFDEAQTELLDRAFNFEALPFVDRVVYLSTPHQGSFLAGNWISRMMAKFIAVPVVLQDTLGSMFKDDTRLPSRFRRRIPTSLDNMEPSNPLLRKLASTSVADRIKQHSIIPVGDADLLDPEAVARADDGVVRYASAHIEPVQSERVVPGEHSCQNRPPAIMEVRRILRLHLGVTDSAADDSTEPDSTETSSP